MYKLKEVKEGFGCIYYLYDKGECVYVGLTKDQTPFRRVGGHQSGGSDSKKEFDSFDYVTMPIDELVEFEKREIEKINPKYNLEHNWRFHSNLFIESVKSSIPKCGTYDQSSLLELVNIARENAKQFKKAGLAKNHSKLKKEVSIIESMMRHAGVSFLSSGNKRKQRSGSRQWERTWEITSVPW